MKSVKLYQKKSFRQMSEEKFSYEFIGRMAIKISNKTSEKLPRYNFEKEEV